MRKSVFTAVVIGATALGVGGIAFATAGAETGRPAGLTIASPSDDQPAEGREFGEFLTDPSLEPASAGEPAVHIEHAKALAEQAAGGGRATKAELEWEHGRLVWEVEVLRRSVEYDLQIDADTGQVVRIRLDSRHGGHG
jgi:hypothetical protein